MAVEKTKVFVVWDPLYEEVVSVHRTEEGALRRLREKDKSDKYGEARESNCHSWDEFELEDCVMATDKTQEEVDQGLRELRDRVNYLKSMTPWWYSGSACLAALAWVCWFALAFMLAMGKIEPNLVTGTLAAVMFLVAIGASVQGAAKK